MTTSSRTRFYAILLVLMLVPAACQTTDTPLPTLRAIPDAPADASIIDTIDTVPTVITSTPETDAAVLDAITPAATMTVADHENSQPDVVASSSQQPEPDAASVTDEAAVAVKTESDVRQIQPPAQTQQITVRFHAGTDQTARDDYIEAAGGSVVRTSTLPDTVVITVPQHNTRLPDSDIVAISEPNYYVTALNSMTQTATWNMTMIGAEDAWTTITETTPAVTVAVVDSGICLTHPQLSGQIVSGYDFVEQDTIPQDDYGHGCSVSGIVAAVAPQAQIMPLRVLDGSGLGTYVDVAEAIVYAADHGATVINLSLGGAYTSRILEDAVTYASGKGVILVGASGNNGGTSPLYPAGYAYVIAVGAVNQNGRIASFSNGGVDMLAPGVNVPVLLNHNSSGYASGTSFAAPHVAGLMVYETVSPVYDGSIVQFEYDDQDIVDNNPDATPTATPIPATPEAIPLRVMVPHPAVQEQAEQAGLSLSQVLPLSGERLERSLSAGPLMDVPLVEGQVNQWKTLVVLVDFSDNVAQQSPAFYNDLIFAEDGDSMRHFYMENSYGQLDMVPVPGNYPDDTGWQRAPGTYQSYANPDGVSGTDDDHGMGVYPNNSQGLVEDILKQIETTNPNLIDFSQYDNNNDGFAENIIFIHAGIGGEATQDANHIWSHSWGLYDYAFELDGVTINQFTWQPEYTFVPGDSTIGVFAHEQGHAFGLPDLYDSDAAGVGNWSLMSGGSWNGNGGDSPAHLDAWSRVTLGYASAINATGYNQPVSLPNVEQNSNAIYRLDTGQAGEYFLLENRQPVGYDAALPSHGLLIWHVDDNMSGSNTTQCTLMDNSQCPIYHYRVALEQADGLLNLENLNLQGNGGDSGDPYPGSSGNTSFTFSSFPNTSSYFASGDPGLRVWKIKNNNGVIDLHIGWDNDYFDYAYTVDSLPYSNTIHTGTATDSVDDPGISVGTGVGKTVWYRYTATQNDLLYLSTAGSNFDTVLAIYTGTRGNLTEVTANDNGVGGMTSQVSLWATAGTTYHIMVAGNNSASGTMTLTVSDAPAFGCTAVTEIPQAECEALETLYNSTGGDQWTNQSGWLQTLTPCSWHGVSCSGGHVTQLSLWSNNLSGTIPADLSNLSELVYLSLSSNNLTGSIPAELSNLSQLSTLDLYNNQLWGSIPPELGNLSNLQYLSLSYNNLDGNIPPEIGNLSALESLLLDHNRVWGVIPSQIGNLSQLQTLYLDHNQLQGDVPLSLLDPGTIINIDLDYNSLYATNSDVRTYLDAMDSNWSQTQTVAPTNLAASNITANSVDLFWNAIPYTAHTGSYDIYYNVNGGNYIYYDSTASKSDTFFQVTRLAASTDYCFKIQTYTAAHDSQMNDLWSEFTGPVCITTNSGGFDTTPPVVTYLSPESYAWLEHNVIIAHADAYDVDNDVSMMQFWLWFDDGMNGTALTDDDSINAPDYAPRSSDGINAQGADWHLIGEDYDGSDGWSVGYEVTNIPDQYLWLVVYAVDSAGNWSDAYWSYQIGLDRQAPETYAYVYDSSGLTENFYVNVMGYDAMVGIKTVDVQVSVNGGAWTDWLVNSVNRGGVYNGSNGNTYAFRSRARDWLGHEEAWSPVADTTVTVSYTRISGTVYDADGVTPLAGAVVATDSSPFTFTCTDENGQYQLDIPAYSQTFKLSAGGHGTFCGPVTHDYTWYGDVQDYNLSPVLTAYAGQMPNMDFIIGLMTDTTPPVIARLSPVDGVWLEHSHIITHADVYDDGRGVDRVDFWVRYDAELSGTALSEQTPPPSPDAESGAQAAGWYFLGTDYESQDGWAAVFDASSITDQYLSFYVYAYDEAGNWAGRGSWGVGLDREAPETYAHAYAPLAAESFYVNIFGWDNLAGIARADVQVRINSGPWTDWLIDNMMSGAMFYGSNGNSYAFRSRARDWLGHEEAYPVVPDVVIDVSYMRISGTVYGEDGHTPVAHIPVTLDRSPLTFTCTDENGNYELTFTADNSTFTVSAGGYGAVCGQVAPGVMWLGDETDYNQADFVTASATVMEGLDISYQTLNPLNKPTDVHAIVNGTDVQLTWTDTNIAEDSYHLERSVDGSNWTHFGAVMTDLVTYTDTGLTCETDYQYRVYAYRVDDSAQSDYSDILHVRSGLCPPPPPVGLSGDATGTTTGQINWSPVDTSRVSQLFLERQETGGSWQTISVLPYNTITYHDTDVKCGTEYTYRLRAYRQPNDSYSTYSDTINITTDPCPTPVTHTVGLYKDGLWLFRDSNDTGAPTTRIRFGPTEPGWIAITGDWDGDGTDGIGLYKDGLWILRNVSDHGSWDTAFTFGEAGWLPVVGDWNGDGVDTPGLYRAGDWRLSNSVVSPGAEIVFHYGDASWLPIVGDWNGSGADTVGLYRQGSWQLTDTLHNIVPQRAIQFGPVQAGWLPITGDWDQNSSTGIGVYRGDLWRLSNQIVDPVPDQGFSFGDPVTGWQPVASYRGDAGALTLLGQMAAEPQINVTPVITETPHITDVAPEATALPTITETPVSTPEATDTEIPVTPEVTPEITATPLPTATATMTAVPETATLAEPEATPDLMPEQTADATQP